MPKMMSDSYLGVDPGKQGGIALIDPTGSKVEYWKMPANDYDLLQLFNQLSVRTKVCYIEQVSTRPGEGHVGAFTFGEGFGKLQMALAANEIPYEKVPPRSWQARLKIKAKEKAESRPQFKERLRCHCRQLFPKLELWSGTLGHQRAVCDAILIAEACRRIGKAIA